MGLVHATQLRAGLARSLSALYGTEVPAYTTLVEVTREVNQRVLAVQGETAERLGSIERVTAERHGAIRVGSAEELAQVGRVFAALGMHPCGFYDLRDAHPQPIPVVSTAFRPLTRTELAANPFRVFTSVLVPEDRRFFDTDLADRVGAFLRARRIFPDDLLLLADRAVSEGGLEPDDAARFLTLATAAFALSREPIDRGWYDELARVSAVAADIAGVGSTHLNHLTPRVLDIDDLYDSMQHRGIEMIDQIQGPPRWSGPDVLLRQTSFRALAEPRTFREPDGSRAEATLRVRFGEVEARGIALTPRGRDAYDRLVADVDHRCASDPTGDRSAVAREVWSAGLPDTEDGLRRQGLGFFTYRLREGVTASSLPTEHQAVRRSGGLEELVDVGLVSATPIVYEDFLPRSAAGIFSSNLTDRGALDDTARVLERDAGWLADAMGRAVHAPEELYAAESAASVAEVAGALGRRVDHVA